MTTNQERIIRMQSKAITERDKLIADQQQVIQTQRTSIRELRQRLHKYEPDLIPEQRDTESPLVAATVSDPLMTPGAVAKLFKVDPKTVTRWAAQGLLPSIKTPGGHRRFKYSVIMEILQKGGEIDATGSDSQAV